MEQSAAARRLHVVDAGVGRPRVVGPFSARARTKKIVALALDVPDDVKHEEANISRLPADWYDHVDSAECRAMGDAWLARAFNVLLGVPSAPVPQESNYLVNPLRPGAHRIHVVATHPFRFDPRLTIRSSL